LNTPAINVGRKSDSAFRHHPKTCGFNINSRHDIEGGRRFAFPSYAFLKRITRSGQPTFPRQTAGIRGIAWHEKILGQRQARVRRRQAMHAGAPIFCREIFQIQPDRRRLLYCHACDEFVWQIAGQRLDHDLARFGVDQRRRPVPNLHAGQMLSEKRGVDFRPYVLKRAQVVYPQSHRDAVFVRHLACQTPGHADITVVIDDAAKDVPGHAAGLQRMCGRSTVLDTGMSVLS
jgi:hypothetical protein